MGGATVTDIAAGDVVAEVDLSGRLVTLWQVIAVGLSLDGIRPFRARRACSRTVEAWPADRLWRRAHTQHHWRAPEVGT